MPYDRSVFITRTPEESVCFDFAAATDMFLFPKLFDPKPVQSAVTKVPQIDTSKLRLFATKKGTNAQANKIDEQLFYRNITLQEYKISSDINPRDARDADRAGQIILSDARKAQLCTLALMNQTESEAVTLATTSANYPAALTQALAVGDRWDDNGDIEQHMAVANLAMRASCGRNANALAIDIQTYDKLRLGANLRSRTQYTNGGPIPDAMISAYFGVQYLFVGRAQRDSALEGATASIAGFWGTNAIAFYYNPSVALEDVSFGQQYLMTAPYWTTTTLDMTRVGPAGPMRNVQVGTEYVLDKGYVTSSGSSTFGAGFLFRTVTS